MSYVKTDADGFVRDDSSKAVLNTDIMAFTAYKQRRAALSESQQMKKDVDSLKTDMQEIKSLLERILREQSK